MSASAPKWTPETKRFIFVVCFFLIGLAIWQFSIVLSPLFVTAFYFMMWQVDTNYLVPRVIGHRLQLSPAILVVDIIAGASVSGALGSEET